MAANVNRIIKIIQRMQGGGRYTTNELLEYLNSELNFSISLRTIQRDLKELEDLGVVYCEESSPNKNIWRIEKATYSTVKKRKLTTEELMSFYILKSHLKTFKSTMIEEEINTLTRKIEEIAPEDIVLSDNLYWDQTIGSFNYFQFDAIIRRTILYISKGNWVEIDYDTAGKGKIKKLIVFIYSIFNYNGALYLVVYEKKHKSFISLALHNIEKMEETNGYGKAPNFDYNEFSKNRFAVFVGKPSLVKIKIPEDILKYFKNRNWHQSQKLKKNNLGDWILSMEVPIKEDLIAWIMSWTPSIEVIEPKELIEKIKERTENTLKLYK